MSDVRQKVSELAAQVADEQGLVIFDIELLGKGKLLLRVMLDKEGGVTLDDCERFSKSFAVLLDVENPVPSSYTLEVSSPGMDRPLKNMNDFEKNIGKLARIVTAEKIRNQSFFVGRISGIEGKIVQLSVKGHEIPIPFDSISKARLEIEL
jgi:ribosome maturation factor RimP